MAGKHNNKEEILAVLKKAAGNIVPFEDGNVYLLDEETGDFSGAAEKENRWLDRRFTGYLEEGIIDWVMEEKRPVVIEDLEFLSDNDSGNTRNFIFVPLTFKKGVPGIFVIYTSKPKEEFTSRDLELLAKLAEKTAGY